MYDAIRAQPAAFGPVVSESREPARRFASALGAGARGPGSGPRLHLVGTGTSFHAAEIGEHLVRAAGGPPARAWRSFDFALYGPELDPGDAVVVVSHRGTKRYSRAAVDCARQAGCATALVTGQAGGAADEGTDRAGAPGTLLKEADVVFRTVPQEHSSAHTVSFTGAVAALAALAAETGTRELAPDLLEQGVPDALRGALGSEAAAAALARRHARRRRIWLAGGGPSATVAREIALKIKETSYGQAEGMATETLLHGPFQCSEPADLFVLVAPAGRAQERTAAVARAVGALGAHLLVVGDASAERIADASGPASAAHLPVPELPEPLSALACTVALQLLTYHLALERATNPDGFRLEDRRFARASELVRL